MFVAFPLHAIERVIRAVAVQAVPAAGGCLLGTIDVAGELVPVYDTRKLLGLRSRALRAADRILLARSPERCGFLVDAVLGTVQPDAVELAGSASLRSAGLRGVARGSAGMLLVQDLRRMLAFERTVRIASDA